MVPEAALVASSVGDTMARDLGYWSGTFTGILSGLAMCSLSACRKARLALLVLQKRAQKNANS